ncbi:hypothetical protein [Aquimarina rhabdastrellae]
MNYKWLLFFILTININAQNFKKSNFSKYKESKNLYDIDKIFQRCFDNMNTYNKIIQEIEQKYSIKLCSIASVLLLYTYSRDLTLKEEELEALEKMFIGFSDKFIEIDKPIIIGGRKRNSKGAKIIKVFLRGMTLTTILDKRINSKIKKNTRIQVLIDKFNENTYSGF